MAAVSQPGSRAGLVTALVVFVVLFFVAAIFAIVKGVDDSKKDESLTRLQKTYRKIVSDSELVGEDAQQLEEARNASEDKGQSLLHLAVAQRNELAKLIKGQGNYDLKTVESVGMALQNANKRLTPAGVSAPGASLVGAIDVLSEAVMDRQKQVDKLNEQLAAEKKDLDAKAAAFQQEATQMKKGVESAKGEAAAVLQQSTAYRQSKDEQISQVQKDLVDAIEKGRKTAEDLTAQISAKSEEVAKLQKEKEKLIEALARFRPQNVADAVIRRPDGYITQVDRNDVLYINLGMGKQLTAGMTFQVYDRNEGVPKVMATDNAGTEVLPMGKGSIEVVRVGADASECRVIRRTPGSHITAGDIIANLIYDPNVKLKFKVYGEFDIDQNGAATAQEGEIIKRLIVQWGGQLTEDVNIDTDFVVLGQEPKLPSFTPERLKDDPIAQFELDKATKALAAYEEVRNKALDLRIPVLNQNRFLYLIGFFDQAKK